MLLGFGVQPIGTRWCFSFTTKYPAKYDDLPGFTVLVLVHHALAHVRHCLLDARASTAAWEAVKLLNVALAMCSLRFTPPYKDEHLRSFQWLQANSAQAFTAPYHGHDGVRNEP